MKLKLRFISLVIALITITTSLAACNTPTPNETKDENEESSSDTASTETADSSLFPEGSFPIFADSKYAVRVVMADNAPDHERGIATKLCAVIKARTKSDINATTDYLAEGSSYDSDAYEILVGRTAHDEAANVYDNTPYNDYGIKIVGKKMVFFFSNNSEGISLVNLFTDSLRNDGNGMFWTSGTLSASTTTAVALLDVPKYPSESVSVVDCSDETHMIVAKSTSFDAFNTYLATLTQSGFTEYSKRENVDGNYFYIYTKGDLALNVSFSSGRAQARIIAGPLDDIPSKEIDQTPETYEPTLTMVAQSESMDNGLALIYMLPNGKFIVIDGGYFLADRIFNEFKELQPDKNKFTIAAWFVSHPHIDHQESLEKIIDLHGHELEIESIFFNYVAPDYYENTTAEGATGYGTAIKRLNNLIRTKLDRSTKVVKPHSGQIYNFGPSAQVEIIFTIEDYLPTQLDRINTSGMIIRVTVDGYSTMILADATSVANDIILKMYNSHLKSDMVTLAHHGVWVDTPKMYELVAAEVLLWPSNTASARRYYNESYSKLTITTAINAATDVFLARNKDLVLPLPYTPVGNRDEFWSYLTAT